jgi:glutaredoxin-related protein
MARLDGLRARAFGLLDRAPGKLGDLARKANEVLGRPLADEAELSDRRAFETKVATPPQAAGKSVPKAAPATEPAPVIVYFMEKQKRDVLKVTDILDANGIPYKAMNIQEDPAAQYAIKRDSNGMRLPVVFVAGECIGGREHLVNAASSGELKKKVFG